MFISPVMFTDFAIIRKGASSDSTAFFLNRRFVQKYGLVPSECSRLIGYDFRALMHLQRAIAGVQGFLISPRKK